jgi:hypothetical protein
MAAGLGFKTFNSGDVLSAADVNGYLMQGVLVFASTAARDAAITAPAEGQFAFTKDTNSLFYYDGAAWVASGAAGDIEGVTAGTGISGGGTSGTVTVTNSMATAIDAKGDLIGGTGADTFARLAVGANDTVLTADSTTATGLKWAAPAGGTSGLNLITTETFSGVSDYTKDSLFSSTYDNYRIVIEFVGSQNAAFQYQLRSGGSNVTSANYARQVAFFASTTSTLDRATGDTNNSLGNTYNTGRNLITMDLASPFLSQHKTHISNAFNTTNTANLNLSNGTVLVTTSCTGIRFFPNNGTITGTVSYYGYGK